MSQAGAVIATPRLVLRLFTLDDAAFVLELVNDPDWLRFIGNKQVATLDDARRYIRNGPQTMYEDCGFCLYLVERCADGMPIGMCGLIQRDALDDVDIGFAFLPQYRGQGYAYEAAAATLAYARDTIGLRRLVAITVPDNERSMSLLGKLGLSFERMIVLDDGKQALKLFGTRL